MKLSASYDIELDVGDAADLSVSPSVVYLLLFSSLQPVLKKQRLLHPARGIELLTNTSVIFGNNAITDEPRSSRSFRSVKTVQELIYDPVQDRITTFNGRIVSR
jgi:hypothetical protein